MFGHCSGMLAIVDLSHVIKDDKIERDVFLKPPPEYDNGKI